MTAGQARRISAPLSTQAHRTLVPRELINPAYSQSFANAYRGARTNPLREAPSAGNGGCWEFPEAFYEPVALVIDTLEGSRQVRGGGGRPAPGAIAGGTWWAHSTGSVLRLSCVLPKTTREEAACMQCIARRAKPKPSVVRRELRVNSTEDGR